MVHVVYLPFDNVCCLTAMGQKQWAIIGLFSEYFHFLSKTSDLKANKINKKHPCVILLYVKEFGYQLCLNLTPSQKNLWSPFNMSPGNDFPRIKNSVRAVEMLTNNHLITLPALTVNYRHLHYAIGAVNLFSVSEKLYLQGRSSQCCKCARAPTFFTKNLLSWNKGISLKSPIHIIILSIIYLSTLTICNPYLRFGSHIWMLK